MAVKKAYEMPFKSITLMPIISLATKRYCFVNTNATGDCVAIGAAARAIGVLQTPGIAFEPCNVMVDGISFVNLGGAVAAGQEVEADANGCAVVLAAGKSNGICVVGGVAGDIGSVLIK